MDNKESSPEELLKPCPFCGGGGEIKQTGKLQITIRCKSCHIGLTQKVFRYSLEWLQGKMLEGWNTRKSTSNLTPSEPVEQRFTIEDMRAAFYAGKDHTADEYRDGETIGFDEWIKTRK